MNLLEVQVRKIVQTTQNFLPRAQNLPAGLQLMHQPQLRILRLSLTQVIPLQDSQGAEAGFAES